MSLPTSRKGVQRTTKNQKPSTHSLGLNVPPVTKGSGVPHTSPSSLWDPNTPPLVNRSSGPQLPGISRNDRGDPHPCQTPPFRKVATDHPGPGLSKRTRRTTDIDRTSQGQTQWTKDDHNGRPREDSVTTGTHTPPCDPDTHPSRKTRWVRSPRGPTRSTAPTTPRRVPVNDHESSSVIWGPDTHL